MKKSHAISMAICITLIISCCGCGGSSKDPFAGLSAKTTRKDIERKYKNVDSEEDEPDIWVYDVNFFDYQGYMHFEFNDSSKNSHLNNAVWYFDEEEDSSAIEDVYAEAFSYFDDSKKYTYIGDQGSSIHGTMKYKKFDGDKGEYLRIYMDDSVFIDFEPMK